MQRDDFCIEERNIGSSICDRTKNLAPVSVYA
jgi:hypothetical protein